MSILLKKIVIVGGGAGGLELATRLGHKLGRTNIAKIVLVDCNHYHLWKPLLHETATGSIDKKIDSISYIEHANNHSFQFQLGRMSGIDRIKKKIFIDSILDKNNELLVPAKYISYDILIISLGSISNDFGISGVKDNCIFLDSPYQADRFHREMMNLFIRNYTQFNYEKKLNIAIVGGGATGVELSAAIYNTSKKLKDYSFYASHNQPLNITLIEAGERILPALPDHTAHAIHKELIKIGVKILNNTIIISTDTKGFYTKDGKYIQANLKVWAAGVKAPDFMKDFGGLETNNINQLLVEPTLQTTRDKNIFAIGDCASCNLKQGGIVPPRAQAAHQMALHTFNNILSLIKKQKLKPYKYKDYGSIVSLSHFNTIGILIGSFIIKNPIMIKGLFARIIYLSLYRIHQIELHGYAKTGLLILVNWINRILRSHIKLY